MVWSRTLLLTVAFCLLLSVAPGIAAHDSIPQPLALDDHPDPGFSPSFALFPTHEEVISSLDAHADHPWVTLHHLGNSTNGRAIVLAEVTDPESETPLDERVITFIFTQQHGNEPAGTPAALRLLDDITDGAPIADTLADQILLLLPMANPDGAAENMRRNAMDHDINRDHMGLETPEANILHMVLNRWDVHVAMDHHEYSGQGFGNPSPVRIYDYDLTTLFPRHGNVHDPTLKAAQDLMYEGIWPRAENDGYSANEYGERTIAGQPYDQLAGGPDPGIMRNHLGLHHIAGLLVETRVDEHPNPFHDAERRADIHSSVMEATLDHVAANARTFIEAKAASRGLDTRTLWNDYIESEATPMAAAYATTADDNASDLLLRHGLHPGHIMADHVVHNISFTPFAGHVAALVHPDSSRAVWSATTHDLVLHQPEDPQVTEDAPAPALPVFALLLGALLAGARSRRTAAA